MAGFFQEFSRAFRDEVVRLTHTPALFITGVIVPLFWSAILACIFSVGLMRGLPVGLIDNDNSYQSRQTIERLEAVPSVRFVRFESVAQAKESLAASKIYALAVFPEHWSEKAAGSRLDSAIELFLNRSYYAIAVTLETDIKLALADAVKESLWASAAKTGGGVNGAKKRFDVVTVDVLMSGNQNFNYLAYLPATLIPGILALGCILTCVGVIAREWRKHTLSEFFSSVQSVRAVILGRLSLWTLIYAVFGIGYVAWFAGWLGFAPVGSLWIWCLGAVLLMTSMVAFALMFVSLLPSWILALSAGICFVAPTFPFTGFSYPIESMDTYAQAFCQIFPLTWFLRVQASQWVLGSDFAYSMGLICTLGLFTVIPAAVGLAILPFKLRYMAKRPVPKDDMREQKPSFWSIAGNVIRRGALNIDTFAIFVVAVAFYLLFYAWPYANQQITAVPVAVVDNDRSGASIEFVNRLHSVTMFKITDTVTDAAVAKDLYQRDVVSAVITIPNDFEADILAGKPTAIRLTSNGAFPVKGRAVMAGVLGVVNELTSASVGLNLVRAGADVSAVKALAMKPAGLAEQSLFNTLSGYAAYIVPVVMPIIIQAILMIAIVMTLGAWLAKEKTSPMLARILGSKKGLLAFFTGFWIFGLAWMLYAIGPDFVIFDFKSMANPIGAITVAGLFLSAVIWMAMTATLILNSNAYGAQFLVLISAPCVFLTGAVFPDPGFLWPARVVADIMPATPGVIALVSTAQNGASLTSLMPEIVHLLLLNAAYACFAFCLARLRAHQRSLVIS